MNLKRELALLLLTTVVVPPVSAGLIENPSFEANYEEEWPHYGPADGWEGISGTNTIDGPFHNVGTPIPDGTLAGFKQGAGVFTQEISDLESGKQYFVQFFYDARACCNGGTVDIAVEIDGLEIDKVENIIPVTAGDPYKFRSAAFTAESDFAILGFRTTVVGDATALIDAVSIVQRDEGELAVMNPSFEASGTLEGDGTIDEFSSLAGWTGEGTFGVNVSGENFADNGSTTDQDHVAFISGIGALSQTIQNVVDEAMYTLTFSYNAADDSTSRLEVTAGATTLFDEDVTPVGGNSEYHTRSIEFMADGESFDLQFSQTAADGVLLLDDIKLSGESGVTYPPILMGPSVSLLTPDERATVSVTVPGARLAVGDVSVKVRITQFEVAEIVDADPDGVLTLEFTAEGESDVTREFEVEGIGAGRVNIEVTESANLEVARLASVEVSEDLVRNASFEIGDLPAGVGYGVIPGWEQGGGTGINDVSQPFLDNGLVPDRKRVALLQGGAEISQQVLGLTVGETYWFQLFYNARNCCGGSIDLSVTLDETEIAVMEDVQPVGPDEPFHFLNVSFTASAEEPVLRIASTAEGDATALLDAISFIPRPANDIVVKNPSFEASYPATGVGYVGPDPLAGWEMSGGYGVNGDTLGPFTDNGIADAGNAVMFLQNAASASQVIEGLTAGATYTLFYKVNRRNCCNPDVPNAYEVEIDDELVLEEEIEAVGAGEPFYQRMIEFTAAGDSARITFRNINDGDQTLLLDDVRVAAKGGPVGTSFDVALEVSIISGNTARIAWPRDAPDAVLQSSTDLVTWSFVESVPFLDGDVIVVADVIDGPVLYYRLLED